MSVGIHELNRDTEGYTQKTNQKYASDVVTVDAPGQMIFMSGAEAVARGAIEAGVALSASFPGAPATWVHENLLMAQKQLDGLYAEWSTTESKAFDVALGAALAGRRAFAPLKQVGVNWIVDSVSDWVTKRALRAGLVILSGDDPGADTTSREQDTRLLVPFLELPLLQPSSVQEQKDVIIEAFELSERIRAPVMVSITRQMMYGRGPVKLGAIDHERRRRAPNYSRDPQMGYTWHGDPWSTTGISEKHAKYHKEALAEAQAHAERSPLNRLELQGGESLGIVTAEQGYVYAKQAVRDLGLQGQVAILKLGTVWPIPRGLTTQLLETVRDVVVVEELEPFVEQQVRALSSRLERHARIWGKEDLGLPYHDAYSMDVVSTALAKVLGRDYQPHLSPAKRANADALRVIGVPDRPWTLCAGCPEMGAMWIVKEALKKATTTDRRRTISVVDEGCYTSTETEPWNMGDVVTCMGSSISIAHGLYRAGVQEKLLVQIGDGSFLHNGLQGLINAVHNNSKMTILIHDNRATAATGQQAVASGFGFNARGEESPRTSLAALCESVGVRMIRTLDPFDVQKGIEIFLEALDYDGLSVVISDGPCSIIETRRVGSRGKWEGQLATYRIDAAKCTSCTLCSRALGCLAIEDRGAHVPPVIVEDECIGCDICRQMCPDDAIFRVEATAEVER